MSWLSKAFSELTGHVNPDVQAAARKAFRRAAVDTVLPLVSQVVQAISEKAGQPVADLVQATFTAEADKWCQ